MDSVELQILKIVNVEGINWYYFIVHLFITSALLFSETTYSTLSMVQIFYHTSKQQKLIIEFI